MLSTDGARNTVGLMTKNDDLVFSGNVVNGIGKHKELVVPGRGQLEGAPHDWPNILFPGSLNIRVSAYPPEFAQRGIAETTKSLDTARFAPAFTIAQTLMGNNKLVSTPEMPHRGTAQVWKAMLQANGQETQCWVLRRFGSGLQDQLELVSHEGLRAKLGLSKDREWPARVAIRGAWLA